ncbi:MAG: hypothetical protein K6C97_11885 [Treponema sp.]|nr:hypothetical protein [Treponema sp.]
MKHFIYIILLAIIGISFLSCGSIPKAESEIQEIETEETVDEVIEDEIMDVDDEVIDLTESEPDEEEYIRSTNNLSSDELVTKQEFADDKAQILKIIDEMQEIMETEDVDGWLKYIAPDSIRYYSSPANIRKAQKKLPNKTIVLNGIGDYFKYVFIPSRKRRSVDEIRYISKTNIKAVDVKDDKSIVVYYQFVKINDKWLVHIPTL